MERNIGTTELRQKLTDVLQKVQEQGASYLLETFGRPQAVIVNLDVYRQYQRFNEKREAFFDWLEEAAERNAERNAGLGEDDILAIIEQAREDVASAAE